MDMGLNVKQPDKILYLLYRDECNHSEQEILNPVLLQDNEKQLCVCAAGHCAHRTRRVLHCEKEIVETRFCDMLRCRHDQ
jgi:hypothetical protein